jgi:hypothetical protein
MKRTLAILSSREGLRLIFETALDATILMNSEGVVADWNAIRTHLWRDRSRGCRAEFFSTSPA